MRTFNLREARAHLSRLVKEAAEGKPFIIAKSGKAMVKVTAVRPTLVHRTRRLGFLAGQIRVPTDFDRMGKKQIVALFDRQQKSD